MRFHVHISEAAAPINASIDVAARTARAA